MRPIPFSAQFVAKGIDAVVPIPVNRRRDGSLIQWHKPTTQVCPEMYVGLPESITLRQFDIEIRTATVQPKLLRWFRQSSIRPFPMPTSRAVSAALELRSRYSLDQVRDAP